MQFLFKNPKYSDFAVCSIRRILVRAVTFLLLPKKVLFRHLVCLRLVTSGYGLCLGRSHGQPPVLPEGWLRPRRVGHLTQAGRDHAHGHHQGQGTQTKGRTGEWVDHRGHRYYKGNCWNTKGQPLIMFKAEYQWHGILRKKGHSELASRTVFATTRECHKAKDLAYRTRYTVLHKDRQKGIVPVLRSHFS